MKIVSPIVTVEYVGGPVDGRIVDVSRDSIAPLCEQDADYFLRLTATILPSGQCAEYASNGPCGCGTLDPVDYIFVEFVRFCDTPGTPMITDEVEF